MNSPDQGHQLAMVQGVGMAGGTGMSSGMNLPSVGGGGAGAGVGGGFSLGGRLAQQSPRETALASAMRSVNAAQRPLNCTTNAASCNNVGLGTSSSQSNQGSSSSGLNFTDELSTRRAILEVLAQHNASAGAQNNNLSGSRTNMDVNMNNMNLGMNANMTNNKLQFQNANPASSTTCDEFNELVKPKMQFGQMNNGGNSNNNNSVLHPSFQSMMANGMMVPPSPMMTTMGKHHHLLHRSASPPVSKKALLMKRACLEAESRPQPLKKKKARTSVDSTLWPFADAAATIAASSVADLDSDSDSEGDCTNSSKKAKLIPASDVPITTYADDDVLSGRGGGTNVHPGNRRFRDLIHANRRRYLRAKKNDKPGISRSIVRSIRKAGGRFLRKDDATGNWFEIGDAGAREKTSQALRQRAPEMRKILFEDEAQRDGMARSAVVEHHAAAAQQQQHQMNMSAMSNMNMGMGMGMGKMDLQQQQQQPFQLSGGEMDLTLPMPSLNPVDQQQQTQPQRRRSAQLQQHSPIPSDTADLRRLAQEQNVGLSATLASLGGPLSKDQQQLQKPSLSCGMQLQQQEQQQQKFLSTIDAQGPQKPSLQLQEQGQGQQQQSSQTTGQAKDMLLQARMGMNPNAAYVQRNAQAWTTQTLLGRGINTFTPNIA